MVFFMGVLKFPPLPKSVNYERMTVASDFVATY